MTRRIVDLVKGLTAVLAIAVLLVGVPWFLWRLGGIPGARLLESFSDPLASDNTRSEQLLAGVLGMIAWFCWVQVAYALVIETSAAVRGRVTNRAPLLPGIQAFAVRLVTAATLTVSPFAPSVAVLAAPIQPLVSFEPVFASPGGSEALVSAAESTPAPRNATQVFAATERDTFWSIAEATLGDGLRWSEIRDANVGLRMADGSTISPTTEEVGAGWQLRLPVDAVLPLHQANEAAETPLDNEAEREWVEVEKRDHFWSIADEALAEAWGRSPTDNEIAPYWADLVETNKDRLLPPGDPNLIYPEQRFELPEMPSDPNAPDAPAPDEEEAIVESSPGSEPEAIPAPTAPAASELPPPQMPTTPALDPDVVSPGGREPSVEQSLTIDDGWPEMAKVALGLGGVAVGAGALSVTLRQRRAHRSAKRLPDTTLAPPAEEASEYERRIRPVADTEAARWVDATNKLITARLAQHKASRLPAVIAMRAGRFGVEVLLDEPCAPIEGFVPGNDENSAWRLHPDLELRMIEAETEDVQPYSPALVPVGSTEAGDLLLDLEQLGVLSVEGNDEDIAGWFRSIAAGLAAAAWSQYCEVVVLGGPPETAQLEQVTVPDDPHAWVETTSLAMRKLHERLSASPYEQRIKPGEIFHPTIVLIMGEQVELAHNLSKVAALVNTPLAVVASCPLAVAERVHLDRRMSTLEPIGVEFVPMITPAAEVSAVAELLDNAVSPEVIEVEEESISDESPKVDEQREPADQVIERIMAPKPVEVRLLGPKPAVEGLQSDPPIKQLSVICYLAFHRSVTSQRLRDTFWLNATSRKTADNAISLVRSILGTTEDGQNRLTRAINSGEYEIDDDVGCDWARAEALITEATGRPADDELRLLRAALGQVNGQVGADAPARQFAWLLDDHSVYGMIERCLLDAAHRLGDLAIENDDAAAAEWAADIGLMVVPGSEAMYRIQMRAAASAGSTRGIQEAFNAAEEEAARMGPWIEVEPETEELLAMLTGNAASQAS